MSEVVWKPVHRVTYEFNLTCGDIERVDVDERYEPKDGVYVCPQCGAEEPVPESRASSRRAGL